MLDRVAVLSTSPCSTLLALELELLLSLGIGESQEELDAIVLIQDAVEVSNDTLGSLTSLEADTINEVKTINVERHTEQSQLLCSHLKECRGRSWSRWRGRAKSAWQGPVMSQHLEDLFGVMQHTASFQSMGTPVQ